MTASVAVLGLMTGALALGTGCMADDGTGEADVAVAVDALSAADVDHVTLTITGAGITPPIVRNLSHTGGQWRGTIGGIPAGTDRTFTAVAYDASNVAIYTGVTSMVTIPRASTTTVLLVLQQATPPSPFRNDLPIIDSVIVSPADALPSEDVSLTFHAHDPNPTDTLSWVWTGPAGANAFDSASGDGGNVLAFTSVWHAPATEGTYRLTLRITDSRGARRTTSVDVRVGGRGAASVRTSFNNWPTITSFSTAESLVAPGGSTAYSGSATDADSDPMIAVLTDDCGGPARSGWTGTWTAPATAGTCVLTLTVTDSRGGVTTGTVDVIVGTVPTPNRGPIFVSTYQSSGAALSGENISFEAVATDPDGDALTFTWSATTGSLGAPASDCCSSNVAWTSSGSRSIVTVQATDPLGGSALATFVVEAPGTTERVSLSQTGGDPDNASTGSTISGDGRYVAFVSGATNLVPGDTNSCDDVFVRDRTTGVTTRVSVSDSGAQGNSTSAAPSISADGRFIAFSSAADNLVAGDTNGGYDIFVHDMVTGTNTRVSVQTGGAQAAAGSILPAISADGRFVAFESTATNLVIGDTSVRADIFLHDRQTVTTTRVSVRSDGTEANGASQYPAISGDGRCVGFYSLATNLVASDTNSRIDTFVHDRVTGITELVSISTAGSQGDQDSYTPSLSADGRFVAFHSDADNLAVDTNGVRDVFVRDRLFGTTELVSISTGHSQAMGESVGTAISDDGRFVAFQSAGVLASEDTNGHWDIYLRDRAAGTTTLVSVPATGLGNDASSFPGHGGPFMSADASLIVFVSQASNLVTPSDGNGAPDIYLRTVP